MRTLFKLMRFFNDLKAVKRGKVPQRVVRRAAHRGVNKALRKIIK